MSFSQPGQYRPGHAQQPGQPYQHPVAEPQQIGGYNYAPINPYQQTSVFPPHQQQQGGPQQQGLGGLDPFMGGMAANMIQQQGSSYLQRGQEFMRTRMGFLSGSSMHYLFNVNGEYVRSKLMLLLTPWLKRWSYARQREQIAGGHPFLPPRQDMNAPDLYIPFMAFCTYCMLCSLTLARGRQWGPDTMYGLVTGGVTAWAVHAALIKLIYYLQHVSAAVPYLEVIAYAGYPFAYACTTVVLATLLRGWLYWAALTVVALLSATFQLRVSKRVLYHEARTFNVQATAHSYVMLGLCTFQFPFLWWLTVRP